MGLARMLGVGDLSHSRFTESARKTGQGATQVPEVRKKDADGVWGLS